jgi:hypothetical protein
MAHATCGPHFFRHLRATWFGHGRHDLETKKNENKTTKICMMGICLNCHGHENNQVSKISWIKTRTRVGLIPNLYCETRKIRTRTQQVQEKNSTRFYCKNETKTKQGYDKKTYPKLMLNTQKVMENSTSIYTFWAPNSKKFLKKLPIYMWPIFTHVHPCVPMYVWAMSELKLNS